MNPIQECMNNIEKHIWYYRQPTIDKLSSYDKGVHIGRADGLQIALNFFTRAAIEFIEERRRNGLI